MNRGTRRHYLGQGVPSGPSKRTVLDDDSSSDDSSDDDIARTVPYRTLAFTQAIVQSPRIFVSYQ